MMLEQLKGCTYDATEMLVYNKGFRFAKEHPLREHPAWVYPLAAAYAHGFTDARDCGLRTGYEMAVDRMFAETGRI